MELGDGGKNRIRFVIRAGDKGINRSGAKVIRSAQERLNAFGQDIAFRREPQQDEFIGAGVEIPALFRLNVQQIATQRLRQQFRRCIYNPVVCIRRIGDQYIGAFRAFGRNFLRAGAGGKPRRQRQGQKYGKAFLHGRFLLHKVKAQAFHPGGDIRSAAGNGAPGDSLPATSGRNSAMAFPVRKACRLHGAKGDNCPAGKVVCPRKACAAAYRSTWITREDCVLLARIFMMRGRLRAGVRACSAAARLMRASQSGGCGFDAEHVAAGRFTNDVDNTPGTQPS